MLEGISTTALLIYVTLLVVALIGLTLLVLLVYSGLLLPVDDVGTRKPPIGRVVIAYKFQKGSYSASGQIFTEAAFIAPNNKALGIYYDDPDKVDSSETRYLVGSVLAEDSDSINEDIVKKFTEKDFKILHLPEVSYAVHTKFPHITTLSILIAVHKAYPRLKDYIEEHKLCAHPFIELYDGKTIHFMAPVSRQDEFYAPECKHTIDADPDLSEGDRTALNTSLFSAPCESIDNQGFNNSVGDDAVKPDVLEKEQDNATQSETVAEVPAVAVDNNDNNNSLEVNEEERSNEDEQASDEQASDEQASDDSSSSFEVLKTEPTE